MLNPSWELVNFLYRELIEAVQNKEDIKEHKLQIFSISERILYCLQEFDLQEFDNDREQD